MTGTSIAARDHARAIAEQFEAQAQNFRAVLPAHIPLERFQRVVMTALNGNPDLMTADRRSLFIACTKAAEDGLYPDGREAALVVYRVQGRPIVQYMPMVAGLRKLTRQSGDVLTLTAGLIYEGDQYEYWVDDQGRHFRHVPSFDGDQGDDKIIAAYAVAKLASGETAMTVMGRAQLEKRRARSRAADRGPWRDWYPEMAMKTAIRALAKELPRASDRDDLHRALERDGESVLPSTPDAPPPAQITQAHAELDDEAQEIIAQHRAQLGETEDDPFSPEPDAAPPLAAAPGKATAPGTPRGCDGNSGGGAPAAEPSSPAAPETTSEGATGGQTGPEPAPATAAAPGPLSVVDGDGVVVAEATGPDDWAHQLHELVRDAPDDQVSAIWDANAERCRALYRRHKNDRTATANLTAIADYCKNIVDGVKRAKYGEVL